ncbi:MAG TPA: hypothetical protein VL400_12465, partial [Polyangiaceae bacterium]|nr:hypothetical protein [Polyangiaceae bacterium]
MATIALPKLLSPTFARNCALSVATLALAVGCNRDAGPSAGKDSVEPGLPALAKPAGADDGTGSQKAKAETPATAKDLAANGADDAAPTTKDDVDDADGEDADGEDAADRAAPRDKTKRPKMRRRASSGQADAAPEALVPGKLVLKRIQLAPKIENREPVDAEETFSAGETDALYAFVEIANPEKRTGKIFVTFVPPMGASSKVTLKVGDVTRWRTWAKR